MRSLRRVIVGVDFSAPSITAALWTAQHLIQPLKGAELRLVHAVVVPEPPGFLRGRYPHLESLVDSAREGAEVRLRELATQLPLEGVKAEVRIGRPVDVLVETARDLVVDLIVVGRHGEQPSVWDHLGSIAEALVRTAAVPVMLATGLRDTRPRHILAALDDDDQSATVLRCASRLAHDFGARVTAVHVMSNAVLSHVLSMQAVTTGQTRFTDEEVRAQFRDEAASWIGRLVESGVEGTRAACEVAFGDPAAEIVSVAERVSADLLVVGRRGRHPMRRALLGSVVRGVLQSASAPVLVAVETEDEVAVW